jgi:predicted RNase H-like nuclease (RuvC/YqgF family)
MRYEALGKPTNVVEAGSIDEVVKKLVDQIAELKKSGEPSDHAKDQIEALNAAIAELKKAAGNPRRVMIRTEDVVRGGIASKEPSAEDRAEIEKLGSQVTKLRKDLENNLREIEALQTRIQKLGGDPGNVPQVRWSRSRTASETQTRLYIASPRNDQVRGYAIAKPGANPVQVEVKELRIGKPMSVSVKAASPAKAESAKPTASVNSLFRVKVAQDKTSSTEAVDPSKLEALEKKLQALQDEVDRLKKSAQPDGEK